MPHVEYIIWIITMFRKVFSEHIRECDMRLFCYKAKCGDAFHLQYEGESGRCRNIFLDMGYSKTYTQVLKGVISNLIRSSEQIDALFLSHIHDDHIGGASRFIKDIQKDCCNNNVFMIDRNVWCHRYSKSKNYREDE